MVVLLAANTVIRDHLGTLTPMPRVAPVIAQDTIFSRFNSSDEFAGRKMYGLKVIADCSSFGGGGSWTDSAGATCSYTHPPTHVDHAA
jgi:hypothetical protein